jgi:23S rRNA (uracil1939-C5)-methyltransferase
MATPVTHEVVIGDLTHDGQGVASVDGERVFIADVLPNETVSITLGKRRRKLRQGHLETVIDASPERTVPGCEYFGRCGGCGLQHLQPAAQLEWKGKAVLETLRRIGGVVPERVGEPITSEPWAYRRRARVGIKYVARKERVLAGFRERSAGYITDMQHCPVLANPFTDCLGDLAETIGGCSVAAQVPQAELAAGDDHGAMVLRVLTAPNAEDRVRLKEFGERWDLDMYLQPGGMDSVTPLVDTATRTLSYRLPAQQLELRFQPTDFVQVNAAVNREMVTRALALLEPRSTDRVLDLFCGLGNFTLPLARRAGEVLGVEGAANLITRAGENAVHNGIDNAVFRVADLAAPEALPAGPFDLVLLDPPRTGAAAMVERMASLQPRQVLYVSCHPGTLARDAAVLCAQGFTLAEVIPIDMFPHTQHVETMALFVA